MLDSWNIRPGDFVETATGVRGMATSVCKILGELVCVEVGFQWVPIKEVISWVPKD